jgi:A/G-specific adenine glycosylase
MERLRARLVDWYHRERRDLPWRRTRDPYAIWVSEIMLQQTRVDVVIPYYRRFLALYPDIPSLARASEEAVLAAWSGLGYYRRARSLHAGARAIVATHGGRLPMIRQELERLPGIGRYTAGAIASIAFGLPEPVLDGNVRRVLCRLAVVPGAHAERLWTLASAWASGPDPASTNQALMELGALVCTPRNPRCDLCPLRARCRARLTGRPECYPAKRPRRASESVGVAVAWISRRGRTLLERPAAGNPLRGAWDLPAAEAEAGGDPCAPLAAHLERLGLHVALGVKLATLSHTIVHRRLRLDVFACRLARGGASGNAALSWVDPLALDDTAVSGATRKVARAVISPRPAHNPAT